MKKSYKDQAREYIEKWVDFETDFATYGTYADLDHLAEILIDTIDLYYPDEYTDEDYEKEVGKLIKAVYDVLLNEYKDKIDQAIENRKNEPEYYYEIIDKELNLTMDETDDYNEAIEIIKKYENRDKKDGDYTPDRYYIYKGKYKRG